MALNMNMIHLLQGLGVARTQRSHAVVGCPWPQFVAHIEAKMTWWNARHGPEEQMTWLNTHRGKERCRISVGVIFHNEWTRASIGAR